MYCPHPHEVIHSARAPCRDSHSQLAVRNRSFLRQRRGLPSMDPGGVQNPCPNSTSHNHRCQRVVRRSPLPDTCLAMPTSPPPTSNRGSRSTLTATSAASDRTSDGKYAARLITHDYGSWTRARLRCLRPNLPAEVGTRTRPGSQVAEGPRVPNTRWRAARLREAHRDEATPAPRSAWADEPGCCAHGR